MFKQSTPIRLCKYDVPSKFIKWDRDMSDDSIALFLDKECMTFFKEWDIDIVHATFIPFR